MNSLVMKGIIVFFLINAIKLAVINYNERFAAAPGFIDFVSITCANAPQQSPIDIPYYNVKQLISYPAYPSHYINRTYYDHINQVVLGADTNGIFGIKPIANYAKLYVHMNKKGYVYDLKEIRFHVYSEHTFEGMKTEMEMQLIHELVGTPSSGINKYLAIAVLFSTAWNEDHKFLEPLFGENKLYSRDPSERYESIPITSMNLNQFFINNDPYYYYEGSGTTPSDCNVKFHWFIMKKVEQMSLKQLYQLQTALTNGYLNGNSRATKGIIKGNKIEYIAKGNTQSVTFSLLVLVLGFIF